MTPAVAIFVKTPGLSPVKTRLARRLGADDAAAFHLAAAACVGAVARASGPALRPLWAVAERDAVGAPQWNDLPSVWQGEGGLAPRLHAVYAQLQAAHGAALLIGADAPQVTPALLLGAAAALHGAPFTLGRARDGGFWLFGGRAPVPEEVWHAVAYSQPGTAADLLAALRPFGAVAPSPALFDADEAEDLPDLLAALDALADPVPEQRALATWLRDRLRPEEHR